MCSTPHDLTHAITITSEVKESGKLCQVTKTNDSFVSTDLYFPCHGNISTLLACYRSVRLGPLSSTFISSTTLLRTKLAYYAFSTICQFKVILLQLECASLWKHTNQLLVFARDGTTIRSGCIFCDPVLEKTCEGTYGRLRKQRGKRRALTPTNIISFKVAPASSSHNPHTLQAKAKEEEAGGVPNYLRWTGLPCTSSNV